LASNSYSTNFPVAQNPISENGQFVTSTSPGVDWSGLQLGGGGNLPVAPVEIAAPGQAESVDYANPNYGDALAVLTGDWGADQSASITVGDIPPTSAGYEEVEIHLRTDPTTGTGYEVAWAYNHDYLLIATWNGGGVVGTGAYTTLLEDHGPQYAIEPGDTLTASIQDDRITVYTDGVQVAQITDSTFSSGNPGFGFNEGGTDEYGISSFSASSSGSNSSGIDPDWIIEDTTSYGDGSNGNILGQNSSTGQIITSSMTAGENTPGYTDLGTPGPQGYIQTPNGSSDFTGYGANTSSSELAVWNMQGGNAASTVDLGTAPGIQWDMMVTPTVSG